MQRESAWRKAERDQWRSLWGTAKWLPLPIRRRQLFSQPIRKQTAAAKGAFLWGGVGSGKTMVMDLFYRSMQEAGGEIKRVHYHEFMLELHSALHQLRLSSSNRHDPLVELAKKIAGSSWALCLDEVEVTDIADAMLLLRLLPLLWSHGLLLIATSNTPPSLLYAKGLNHQLFQPIRDLLPHHCHVISFGQSGPDYRSSFASHYSLFYCPVDEASAAALDAAFADLSGTPREADVVFQTSPGRQIVIPQASSSHLDSSHASPIAVPSTFSSPSSSSSVSSPPRVAYFCFSSLCSQPLGASDFLAISRAFDVVIIHNTPSLGSTEQENEARRFVNMIDIFYEANTILLISCQVPLTALFVDGHDKQSPNKQKQQDRGEMARPRGSDGYGPCIEDAVSSRGPAPLIAFPPGVASESPYASSKEHKISVLGEGGSSGRSTTMVGNTEWSATGLKDASLAQLGMGGESSYTRKAFARTMSRLGEMLSMDYVRRNERVGERMLRWLSDSR